MPSPVSPSLRFRCARHEPYSIPYQQRSPTTDATRPHTSERAHSSLTNLPHQTRGHQPRQESWWIPDGQLTTPHQQRIFARCCLPPLLLLLLLLMRLARLSPVLFYPARSWSTLPRSRSKKQEDLDDNRFHLLEADRQLRRNTNRACYAYADRDRYILMPPHPICTSDQGYCD